MHHSGFILSSPLGFEIAPVIVVEIGAWSFNLLPSYQVASFFTPACIFRREIDDLEKTPKGSINPGEREGMDVDVRGEGEVDLNQAIKKFVPFGLKRSR